MKQTRRQFLVTSSLVMAGAVVTKSYPKIKDKGTLKGPVCISTWSHGYVANKVSMKAMQNGKTSLDAVELGRRGDPVDFCGQGGVLGVQVGTVRVTQGTVHRLFAEFLHTQQNVGDLVQCAFTGLHQGDTVSRVPGRLVQGADVGFQALTACQTSSVVTGAVDPETGAQLLHGIGQCHG